MNKDLHKQIKLILSSNLKPTVKMTKLIGRSGLITMALRQVKNLPVKERAQTGRDLNNLKQRVALLLKPKQQSAVTFDLSVPARRQYVGSQHLINHSIDKMVDIFVTLGFEPVVGPEIVTDYDNFGSLNFNDDHPARDTQDSLLLAKKLGWLLRTQTSAMQVPIMQKRQPPIRVIVPGKTYRRELDATHMPMFHQLEGFIVDESVTFTDLKGLMAYFVERFFYQDMPMRFRPHYFPFTEPSAEVDILWEKSNGNKEWLEILGCGSIHPTVLENAGINSRKYQGIAFGLGIERPTMLRYGINDMRLLYANDQNFINQFLGL